MDLQVHVLQTWLGGNDSNLLKALSSLDIACTSKSLRQQFMSLAGHPHLGWSTCLDSSWDCGNRYLCIFMKWLSVRRVGLRTLSLVSIPSADSETIPTVLSLPFVDSLKIKSILPPDKDATPTDELPFLRYLLTSCPSLTSFYNQKCDWNKLWNTLQHCAKDTMRLKQLQYYPYVDCYWADYGEDAVACRALAAMGPSLEELRISCLPLSRAVVDTLVACCAQLKVLEVAGAKVEDVLLLLPGCKQLTELALAFVGVGEDAHQILNAAATYGKLRKFTLHRDATDAGGFAFKLFVEMVQRYPWLDYLKVGGSIHSHESLAIREIEFAYGALESLRDLLECARVRHVTSLSLQLMSKDTEALHQICTAVGANLTELNISTCNFNHSLGEPQVTAIFTHCKALTKLSLRNIIPKWKPLLSLCPGLRHLNVIGGYSSNHLRIDDFALQTILTRCPRLKEVEFNCITEKISSQTLQFMAEHKNGLSLEKLSLRKPGISQDDVSQFRQLICQQQWLPALNICLIVE